MFNSHVVTVGGLTLGNVHSFLFFDGGGICVMHSLSLAVSDRCMCSALCYDTDRVLNDRIY